MWSYVNGVFGTYCTIPVWVKIGPEDLFSVVTHILGVSEF